MRPGVASRLHLRLGHPAPLALTPRKAEPVTPHRHICLTFEYYGVQVDAYTFIPVT